MTRFDFQEIVERLPLVVYVDKLDEASSPIYVSPEIERLLGYTREEWMSDPKLFARSLHPEDRDRVMAEIGERNRTQRGIRYADYRLIARDGRIVWVRDDEVIVAGVDGAPAVAQGYMQDVTARRRDRMRLELLVGILGLAAEERTPAEIMVEAARLLAGSVGDVNVTFVEVAADGRLRARYSTENNGPVVDTLSIPGYLERLETGPIVVPDVTEEAWLADVQDELAEQHVGSSVDVPLRRDGRVVGVLWFNTPGPRNWDDDDVTVFSEVAEQLATVLGNAEARESRRQAERDLHSRDAILEAVTYGAEIFLKQPLLDDAMSDLMRALGEATGASRAYVFENLPGEGQLPWTQRRTQWAVPRWDWDVEDPRLGEVSPAPHFPGWAEVLERGDVVNSQVRCLPPDEREPIELTAALSIVAVPVTVDGFWWGFIGFDDCEQEREWSAAEIDALRAAAGLVAAGVKRESAERDLRRRDAILEAVSSGAQQLVVAPDWRDAALAFVRNLGEASGASRCSLFENGIGSRGQIVSREQFEWVADGIEPQIGKPQLQALDFEKFGLTDFSDRIARNEIVAVHTGDLPEVERTFFEAGDVRSVVTVPIFLGNEWWGFIGFDDCVSERHWSPAETDALRTAASLVAAAIERERAEVILRGHEEKLRAVFDTALDAIFITDDERRYVDVNPAGCELIGVAKRDLLGRYVDDFLPPERRELVSETWDAYIQAGPVREEWQTMRPDGTVIVSEASARPNFVPGLHISFMRDITDRKRLEAELLSAQKLESLGRLAGGIAHDFNNLLTGITGYASLLLERTNGDGELRRDLTEIVRAADRATELTRQLLAFGRRQVLRPRPLDLNTITADVGSMLKRLLGAEVELVIHSAPDLGIVRADPGQIEQVIVNLAVNAKDAMPDGGRLTIATRNGEHDSVELVVTDTGSGMDESTVAQIFEPFFTTREEGVGLGLASVYGIIHQSDGEVSVESVPGRGSVFTITLPRVYELPRPEAPAPEPAALPGTETILLVEDEDIVRNLTRRVLERQGYTVLACANGEAAVALAEAEESQIDLLLTDVVMPGMRGYEVAALVSASRPEIKILFMSGYAEEVLVGRPVISDHPLIEKPFAVDTLARRVREALEA